MTNLNDTTKLHALRDSRATARDILQHVYRALQAKGYDPITQLTGFILTGDPTYITSLLFPFLDTVNQCRYLRTAKMASSF